jgi:parvulin-like peptidyl-prolyl isomerase
MLSVFRPVGRIGVLVAISAAASFGAPVLAQQAPPPAPSQPQRTILQRILLKVNGEAFTQTELVQFQIEVLKAEKQMAATPRDLETNEALRTALLEITPKILLRVVDDLLMIQRGRELGYALTDQLFAQSLDKLKKDFNLDDAALRQELAKEGFTMEAYRTFAERQHIIGQVQRSEVMQRASLTEQESRQYYNTHQNEFQTAPTVSVRELSIAVPTIMQDGRPVINAAADEDAKKRITAIRDRAIAGEDYAKLVTELSDSPSKATGGLISGIKLGDIDPSLRAALEKVPAGGVSEPVRMSSGYSIFKIEDKIEAKPRPFDEVREEIANRIYAERVEAESQKYVEKLRAQALIEWKDPQLKAMYEKALAERRAASGNANGNGR